MGALSIWHWLIVLAVVLLLFGSKKLPDAARGLGRSMRIFKSEMKEMQNDDKAGEPQDPQAITQGGQTDAAQFVQPQAQQYTQPQSQPPAQPQNFPQAPQQPYQQPAPSPSPQAPQQPGPPQQHSDPTAPINGGQGQPGQ